MHRRKRKRKIKILEDLFILLFRSRWLDHLDFIDEGRFLDDLLGRNEGNPSKKKRFKNKLKKKKGGVVHN